MILKYNKNKIKIKIVYIYLKNHLHKIFPYYLENKIRLYYLYNPWLILSI